MTVEFYKTQYYLAFQKKHPDLNNDKAIASYAHKNSQFHYGEVTYKDFCREYNQDRWFLRKVIAIPYAFMIGVVQTIFHLAIALLNVSNGCQVSKMLFYRAFRDLQEGTGWLITFFDDYNGSYLIQNSVFQRQCYQCIKQPLASN